MKQEIYNKLGYTRITKRAARNLYYNHVNDKRYTIYILACNLAPDNPYFPVVAIPLDVDFDSFVFDYMYYNCNYKTGYYPAFFVKEGVL